ncbi:protein CREG1-like [Anopheles merus]|uniref:protein CREG1-like n=1 Tax=Anopheles merus TaxID=30066 RepID=UPI001BE4DCE3|nr:protein CREG1-like [Anopheles merus]
MTIPSVTYKQFGETVAPVAPVGTKRWIVLYIMVSAILLTTLACWNNLSGGSLIEMFEDDSDGPPPHTEYAKMARYLVHKAEWVSMGSLSTVDAIKGFPMVNIISVADSARGEKSTGTLYFYLTMLDYTAQDLDRDNRLTVMLTLDQDLYCTRNGIDPMEPTCARIMVSGRADKIENGTAEYAFGSRAMFSRHPAAQKWIQTDGHNFFLCKLNITQIAVLDFYGGPHYVTMADYLAADPDKRSKAASSSSSSNTSERQIPPRFSTTEGTTAMP